MGMAAMDTLTKDTLRPLFITICSTPSNRCAITESFFDNYDSIAEQMKLDVDDYDWREPNPINTALVEWFVEQILTDSVVDYINENMQRHFVVECNTPDNDVDYVREHAYAEARELGHPSMLDEEGPQSVFPIVGNYPSCLVSSFFGSFGGGMHGVLYYFASETFITCDGRIVVADTSEYTYTRHDKGDHTPDMVIRQERPAEEADLTLDILDELFDEEFREIVTHD